jgi:translation initiation factor IF-2
MLASASDANIIGFNVRPAPGNARQLADKEEIDSLLLYHIRSNR